MTVTGLPKLKRVVINGVDVSDYVLTFSVSEKFDQYIRTASIGLKKTVNTLINFDNSSLIGTSITIQRGISSATEKYIFRGYVRKTEFSGGRVIIGCEDKLSEAKYTIVNTSYDSNVDAQAGVIDAIIRDLIDDRTTGLSYVAGTTIQDSGTVNILKKFVLKQRVLMDAFTELAFNLDWQIYYNSEDDYVYFEPKGFTTNSTILSTANNIVKLPKWEIDSTQLFNRIHIHGSNQSVLTKEGPYQLNGSQPGWGVSSITLQQKPDTVKVFSDTGTTPTTEKVGGISGSSSSYDYEVDKLQNQILFNGNFTPTTSFYAIVEYTYSIPVNVTRKNDTSINNYGMKSKSQFREDLKTNSDAEEWAASQLAIYSEPFYKTTLAIRSEADLQIGNIYQVEDLVQNITRNLMIKSITITYPYRYDIIEVADQTWRTSNWGTGIPQRLKRLEEKQAGDSDIITSLIDLSRSVKHERRYMYLEKKDRSSDGVNTFIWGHPTLGIWGTQKWGDAGTAFSTTKIVQGNNTYKEFFYDEDFKGTGTATWNTSTKALEFTSGQTHTTGNIALGTTYNYFTLIIASQTGTITYEISGDGGVTWQTVSTLNLRTTFIVADITGVKLRFTEAGSTTASIENTYLASGRYNQPGIKLILEE